MDVHAVPRALRSALGPEGTSGLLELLDLSHREERETVIHACTERFERRLVDEVSKLRLEVAHFAAGPREELAGMRADLRQDMATIRLDLRQEIATMRAGLRQDIAGGRVELFKWCFLFWVGQVLAIGGLLGVML